MGADDQDKPPRRPSSHWDDDKRVHGGRRTPPRSVTAQPAPDDAAEEEAVHVELDPELERSVGADVARQLRELSEELTPPPFDLGTHRLREPTPGESWTHADNVSKRVVNLLSAIAHQAGAGMTFGDEIRKLRRHRKLTIGISIGSLLSVIAALIAVGTKLYGKGFEAGEDKSWKTYIERTVDKNADRIDRLDNRIDRIEGRRGDAPRFDFFTPKVTP